MVWTLWCCKNHLEGLPLWVFWCCLLVLLPCLVCCSLPDLLLVVCCVCVCVCARVVVIMYVVILCGPPSWSTLPLLLFVAACCYLLLCVAVCCCYGNTNPMCALYVVIFTATKVCVDVCTKWPLRASKKTNEHTSNSHASDPMRVC